MDYGNTKTPSMHPRLGSLTLSQLAFPGEGNPNFPWEKSHWNNCNKKIFEIGEVVCVTKEITTYVLFLVGIYRQVM